MHVTKIRKFCATAHESFLADTLVLFERARARERADGVRFAILAPAELHIFGVNNRYTACGKMSEGPLTEGLGHNCYVRR